MMIAMAVSLYFAILLGFRKGLASVAPIGGDWVIAALWPWSLPSALAEIVGRYYVNTLTL